ncbi:polyketide cyclase [Intrasporangium oryzae NRRL B-24470]|uniref:Polyketide cyclase n=1 Tax=Intrasporangium oryzae NRRL B-24470 TaxID=1386089 RepID=W9G8R6_9MICO|nr:SRPBCC domain-containing protein [Intrasporangium oryzae]EWT00264.1 polyketide cyclase [Intrasporangium oryzae NRRL B-24470]
MTDILHRVGITAPQDAVLRALTTAEGLAGWWTEDTVGDGTPGGTLEFRFIPGGFDMKVLEAQADHVLWEVTGGPEEWVGTQVSWDLRTEGDFTIILFAHRGWREPVEFMYHCSTKWATFLMSLKSLLETGTGAPAPHDVQISDWH